MYFFYALKKIIQIYKIYLLCVFYNLVLIFLNFSSYVKQNNLPKHYFFVYEHPEL